MYFAGAEQEGAPTHNHEKVFVADQKAWEEFKTKVN